MRLSCLFPLAIVVSSVPAVALGQSNAGDNQDNPDVVQKLFDCRSIEVAEERLACFDREIDIVFKARESKEIVITDREQIKETRRGLFGFTLPKIGLFGGGDDKDDEVNEIIAKVAVARQQRNGRYLITLEDGARWAQTDNTPVLRDIDAGETIVIKTAALGSYMAKVGSRRAFRVKRVD